jgi:hypothetical protein
MSSDFAPQNTSQAKQVKKLHPSKGVAFALKQGIKTAENSLASGKKLLVTP